MSGYSCQAIRVYSLSHPQASEIGLHIFFNKQPHFPVEPQVAIGSAQNEAQNCYEVANVFWRL